MSASCDLSFMRKLLTIVIVFICFSIFSKSIIPDYISAGPEHLTITLGDTGVTQKNYKFYADKIVTILIPPSLPDDNKKIAEKPRECFAIVGEEDIRNEESDNEKEWKKTWRGKYPKLIRKLSDVGARVIVFDIGFDTKMDETDTPLTEAIQQAKKRGTSVIIAFGYLNKDYKPLIADNFKKAVGDGYGLACADQRFGDVIKTRLAVVGGKFAGDNGLYALSLKAVAAYFAGKIDYVDCESGQIKIKSNNNIDKKNDTCRFFDSNILDSNKFGNFKKKVKPVIRDARLFIDITPKDKLNFIPYDENVKKILENDKLENNNNDKNLDEILKNDDSAELQTIFNSRIVLIGAASEEDKHSIPGDKRYGVLIQADAIDTIFKDIEDNRSIQSLPEWLEYVFIALFAIYGTILSSYIAWRETCYSRLLFAVSIIILSMISCFLFSWYLYTQTRILANWAYYFIAFLSVVSIEWIQRSILTRRRHAQKS